jgi:hypothetical protein
MDASPIGREGRDVQILCVQEQRLYLALLTEIGTQSE